MNILGKLIPAFGQVAPPSKPPASPASDADRATQTCDDMTFSRMEKIADKAKIQTPASGSWYNGLSVQSQELLGAPGTLKISEKDGRLGAVVQGGSHSRPVSASFSDKGSPQSPVIDVQLPGFFESDQSTKNVSFSFNQGSLEVKSHTTIQHDSGLSWQLKESVDNTNLDFIMAPGRGSRMKVGTVKVSAGFGDAYGHDDGWLSLERGVTPTRKVGSDTVLDRGTERDTYSDEVWRKGDEFGVSGNENHRKSDEISVDSPRGFSWSKVSNTRGKVDSALDLIAPETRPARAPRP